MNPISFLIDKGNKIKHKMKLKYIMENLPNAGVKSFASKSYPILFNIRHAIGYKF